MTDMLERMARALCSQDAQVNPALHDKVWHLYVRASQAALSAIQSAPLEERMALARELSGFTLDREARLRAVANTAELLVKNTDSEWRIDYPSGRIDALAAALAALQPGDMGDE